MEKVALIAMLIVALLLTAAFVALRKPRHLTYTSCAVLDLSTGVLTPCEEEEGSRTVHTQPC